MRLAEARSADGDERSRRIGKEVERILSENGAISAVSEVTLAELWSNLYVYSRDAKWPSCDQAWVDAVESEVLRWIDDDVVLVLPPLPRIVEWALVQVAAATREHGRNLRAWDAIHLGYATHWARDTGEQVRLVSSDKSIVGFVEVFPEFAGLIQLVQLV
jgi:hypothetical protein